MERSEEIPKTEPAEEIIEAKIEHVSGIGIFINRFSAETFSVSFFAETCFFENK